MSNCLFYTYTVREGLIRQLGVEIVYFSVVKGLGKFKVPFHDFKHFM
jgi:hypothetical protein